MKLFLLFNLLLRLLNRLFESFDHRTRQRAEFQKNSNNAKARAYDKLARAIKARRRVGDADGGERLQDDGFKRDD